MISTAVLVMGEQSLTIRFFCVPRAALSGTLGPRLLSLGMNVAVKFLGGLISVPLILDIIDSPLAKSNKKRFEPRPYPTFAKYYGDC